MRQRPLNRRSLSLAVAALVVLLDQVTKAWVVAALENPGRSFDIIDGFLRFRVTRNPGAAFSSFTSGGPLLGLVALGVVIVLYAMAGGLHRRLDLLAIGLVLGGAMGNLVDRVVRGAGVLDGAVVDFIDFSFFPTFNVADSGITIGVALLLLGAMRADHADAD